MSNRNEQVIRILSVLSLLERNPKGLTVSEIHESLKERGFDSGKRTIYRDVEALQGIGIPINSTKESTDLGTDGAGNRFFMESNTKINGYLILSARELMALYLARGMLKPLEATPFFKDLTDVFSKIEQKLGDKAISYLSEVGSEIRFEPGPKWGLGIQPDIVDTLRAACTEGQVVQVDYSSTNSKTTRVRKLGAHYLLFKTGSLYLIAEDLEDNQVKTFALPRMRTAELTPDPYQGKIVSPEDFFKNSFGIFRTDGPEQIEIQFNEKIGPYIRERGWHPTQSIVSKSDCSILLKLEVGITPELIQWVLSFGCDAHVVKPARLAEAVADAAAMVVKAYRPNKAS